MSGIHHVTAISGNAERNLEFYKHVIGLRFVKKTVTSTIPGHITSTMATGSAIPVPSSPFFRGSTRHRDVRAWV